MMPARPGQQESSLTRRVADRRAGNYSGVVTAYGTDAQKRPARHRVVFMQEVRRRQVLSRIGGLVMAGAAAGLGGAGTAGCDAYRAHAAAVRRTTPGTPLWHFSTGADRVQFALAAADGMVYVHGTTPPVHTSVTYGINAATGQVVWRAHRSVIELAYAAGADAVYGYLGSNAPASTVIALQASTGRVRWTYDIGAKLSADFWLPLSYAGGVVYAQTLEPGLLALDAGTGRRLWGLAGLAAQVTADGAAFVSLSATAGRLAALNATTGTERWEAVTSRVLSPLAVTDGVVCGLADQRAYAFSSTTGHSLWHTSLGGTSLDGTVPALASATAGRTVFFVRDQAAYGGRFMVWALNARTGARMWTRGPARGQRLQAVATDTSTLYLGMADGTLLALAAATGRTRWSQRLETPVQRIVTDDTTVYAADADGTIHAFRT
jgi:outer membrane protein assembly factor BamB